MVPIYLARGLADGRHQELLALAPRAYGPRAYGPLAN
jgi:hypothetical protein